MFDMERWIAHMHWRSACCGIPALLVAACLSFCLPLNFGFAADAEFQQWLAATA
jgi:hypothetical protein